MDCVYYLSSPGRSLLLSDTGFYSTTTLPPEKLSDDIHSRMPDDWNKTTPKEALFLIAANRDRIRASIHADRSVFPAFHMKDLSYTAACDAAKRLLVAFQDGTVFMIHYENLLPEDAVEIHLHHDFPSTDKDLERIMLQAEMLI